MQSTCYTELDQFTLRSLEVLAAQTTTLSPQAIHVAQRDTLINAIIRGEVVPIIEPQDAPIVTDRINLSEFARECASDVILSNCYNCQHEGVTNSDDTCVECGVSYLSPFAPVIEPVTPQVEYVTRWTLTDLWSCFNVATILVLLMVLCGARIRHRKAHTYQPSRETVSFSSGPFAVWHGGYNRGVR